MELILLKDVENVGRKGEVVRVRDGFARNFLFPQKLALAATKENQTFVEEQRARGLKRQEKEKAEAQAAAAKLSKVKLTVEAQAGDKDKLFGSVTNEDIAHALSQKGYAVDKKKVYLSEAIRSLGSYTVAVEIYPEVKANVTVEVVRKS